MEELVRVSRGLWRSPDQLGSELDRMAVLLSALPGDAVLAGRSAAQLHGFWLPSMAAERCEVVLPSSTERPRGRAHSRRAELLVHRQVLPASDISVVAGLAVTSPARTWFDLARSLSPADLVAAGDGLLRSGLEHDELRAVVDRSRRRRGVGRARDVLELLDGASASRPESHLRYALLAAGLPVPEVNTALCVNGEWIGIPDLSYDEARLALEYQGADHAGSHRMRRDITRGLDFQDVGWRVMMFGPNEVFRRPDFVASLVRAALQERAPGLLGR